jgi:hypothetical protein
MAPGALLRIRTFPGLSLGGGVNSARGGLCLAAQLRNREPNENRRNYKERRC